MMRCWMDRVVIRDAAHQRGFRPYCGAPSLTDYSGRVLWWKKGGLMYCGAVEFVCSPAAVRHIPVLLDECMGFLKPENGSAFADLLLGEVVILAKFFKQIPLTALWQWTVTRMHLPAPSP